jgi:hypothetical protein
MNPTRSPEEFVGIASVSLQRVLVMVHHPVLQEPSIEPSGPGQPSNTVHKDVVLGGQIRPGKKEPSRPWPRLQNCL